jgi:hypothetical protein
MNRLSTLCLAFALGALALLSLTVEAQPVQAHPASTSIDVEYQPSSQKLSLQVPVGVVPEIKELIRPAVFALTIPQTMPAKGRDQHFSTGLVSRYQVMQGAHGTRVILSLREPLNGAWAVGVNGQKMVFALQPRLVVEPPASRKPPAQTLSKKPSSSPKPLSTHASVSSKRLSHAPLPKAPLAALPRVPAMNVLPLPKPQPSAVQELPNLEAPKAPVAAKVLAIPNVLKSPRPLSKATPKPPQPMATATPKPAVAEAPLAPKPSVLHPVASARGNYTHVGRIIYDEDSRLLTVAVARGIKPTFAMLDNPPRLLMDLPGTVLPVMEDQKHPDALVTTVVAYQMTPTTTRLQLTFARPIGSNWVYQQSDSHVTLLFDRRPVAVQ